MKLRVVVIMLVCAAGALTISTGSSADDPDKQLKSHTEALPQILDRFYPPTRPAPEYWIAMLGLARSFSGAVCDVLENDMENARLNFEKFKTAYVENAGLIPEWDDYYPMKPIEEMSAALMTGDPAVIMPAAESVGSVCHRCHVAYMAPVQQKYRWGSFDDISMTDPLTGRDVSFAELMLMMETNFDGIGNDLSQGQVAGAQKQFDGFQLRFLEIREACMICHESERYYYVSDDIIERISKLGEELKRSEIDQGKVGGLIKTIGQESCSKCHLVHIPAAYGQQNLRPH